MKNNYFNIIIVSWGMLLGGVFNYLYHPFMLQFMTLEDFGTLGSLVWILNIVGIIATGITLFLNKEISQNISNHSKIYFIYQTLLKYIIFIGIIWCILFALLSPFIAQYLQISEIGYVILVGSTILLSLIAAVIMAVLRGMKKYEYIGFYQAFLPILKLIIWVWLVYFWYNIYGAIWWVILSGILGLGISFLFIKSIFKYISPEWNTTQLLADFKENKNNIVQFFLVSFLFAIFMNVDVILVKNIFDATTAWAYAGISVLGKFLIFLMLSTETVYYSQIMEHVRKKLPYQLIIYPIIVLAVIAAWAIAVNLVIWEYILWLLKEELIAYYPIYILSLFYYGLLAFMSLFSKILVGWKSYKGNIALWIWTILLVSTVYLFWNSWLESFVYCFIATWCFTTMILSGIFYYEWKK